MPDLTQAGREMEHAVPALKVMRDAKIGHPDRCKDAVSLEIARACNGLLILNMLLVAFCISRKAFSLVDFGPKSQGFAPNRFDWSISDPSRKDSHQIASISA